MQTGLYHHIQLILLHLAYGEIWLQTTNGLTQDLKIENE